MFPEAFTKMADKWFNGYQDEKQVIIDDVDSSHGTDSFGYLLKIITDHYGCRVETKGGMVPLMAEKIVITS